MVSGGNLLDRRAVVATLLADRGDLLVVSGLGSSTYDANAAGDHDANFYLWGAMGSAALIGLGLAQAQPKRRVLVVTGDGEQLMGLFGDRTGVIGRRMPEKDVDHAPFAGDGPVTDGSRWLVLADDPAGFARDLYAAVRHLDALGLEEILVEEAGEGDEGAKQDRKGQEE